MSESITFLLQLLGSPACPMDAMAWLLPTAGRHRENTALGAVGLRKPYLVEICGFGGTGEELQAAFPLPPANPCDSSVSEVWDVVGLMGRVQMLSALRDVY